MALVDSIAAYLVTVALIELTPGPTSAYLLLLSAAQGRRAGLLAVAGVTVGLAIYLAASVAGLEALVALWPQGLTVLRWVGVAYIGLMAIEAWRAQRPPEASVPTAVATPGGIFVRGMLASLLNPKTAVFYISLLPGFIRRDGGSIGAQIVGLGLIHLAVAILVHIGLAVGGAGLARLAPSGLRSGGWMGKGAAVGLGAVAVWLAFQTA